MKVQSPFKCIFRYFIKTNTYDVITTQGYTIISHLTQDQAYDLAHWLIQKDKIPGEIYNLPIAEFEKEDDKKLCPICGSRFIPRNEYERFCSVTCSLEAR